MLLSEVLASLSNETEHVSDMVQLDHAGRLVLVVEPGMTTDEAVAFEASRTPQWLHSEVIFSGLLSCILQGCQG